MAARIRKELGRDVDMIAGGYGEFKVCVGDEVVAENGALGFLGVLPPIGEIVERVRAKIGPSTTA